MKYIYCKDREGKERVIIFGALDFHCDMARLVGAQEVMSAGFCEVDQYHVARVYGESESLHIKADTEKYERIINIMLGLSQEYAIASIEKEQHDSQEEKEN